MPEFNTYGLLSLSIDLDKLDLLLHLQILHFDLRCSFKQNIGAYLIHFAGLVYILATLARAGSKRLCHLIIVRKFLRCKCTRSKKKIERLL